MADISKLTLNGTSYDLKDATARNWASSALSLISTIEQAGVQYSVSSSLPVAGSAYTGWIYLIPDPLSASSNIKDEYICIGNGTSYIWEKIGTTATDLSPYISGTLSVITVPSSTHSHMLPAIESISYTPAGSIDLGMVIGENLNTASVTQSAVDISLTGSYTPAGTIAVDSTAGTTSVTASVSGNYDKALASTITNTATDATITNTETAATVTGAAYTPVGTIASHLTSGDLKVVTSVTLVPQLSYADPTIATSTKASALTSATLQYTYDSTNENLTFGSGTSVVALSITSANCFTGFTLSQGTSSEGPLPTAQATYISFSGSSATITPTVKYSKATKVSYSKATAFTLSYSTTALTLEGNVDVPAYKFTGTAGTITTSGTYSKVSVVKYDSISFQPTFSGSAVSLAVSYASMFSPNDKTNGVKTGWYGAISGVSGIASGGDLPDSSASGGDQPGGGSEIDPTPQDPTG